MSNIALYVLLPIGIFIALAALGWYLIPYALALKKNLGFTFLPQNQALAIMNGESLDHVIAALDGWVVVGTNILRVDTMYPQTGTSFRAEIMGVYWYGLPPFRKIHHYPFRWGKWVAQANSGSPTEVIVSREDTETGSVYHRFPYAMRFEGLETSARTAVDSQGRSGLVVRLNLEFLVEVQAVNIHLMLFPDAPWLTRLTAMIEEQIRVIVGQKTFEELIEERDADDHKAGIAGQLMVKLSGDTDGTNDYPIVRAITNDTITNDAMLKLHTVTACGVMVRRIDLRSIKIAGTPAEVKAIEDVINGPGLAAKKAQARVTEGEAEGKFKLSIGTAEANVIAKIGEAEAGAVAAKVAAYGDHPDAAALAMATAMEKGMAAFRGGTLVLGNSGTNMLLPTDGQGGGSPQPAPQAPRTQPAPQQWRRPNRGQQRNQRQGQGQQ